MIQPGQIIRPSNSLIILATNKFKRNKNMFFGFLCQWAHDEFLVANGINIQLYESHAPFDRTINGVNYDDKLSMMNEYGVASKTHTIGSTEKPLWDNIGMRINSFEQIDIKDPFVFRFIKTYDYKQLKINQSQFRSPGKDNTFYFFR